MKTIKDGINVGGSAYTSGNIQLSGSKRRNISARNYVEGNVSGGNIAGRDVTRIAQTVTNSTVHGSIVAAEKIENSFNSLPASKADENIKNLLSDLLTEIQALNEKVPPAQAQQLADMVEGTETLINETVRETPRKKWYEASLSGIKEAALAIGDIARPVLAVAEKLSLLLLSL